MNDGWVPGVPDVPDVDVPLAGVTRVRVLVEPVTHTPFPSALSRTAPSGRVMVAVTDPEPVSRQLTEPAITLATHRHPPPIDRLTGPAGTGVVEVIRAVLGSTASTVSATELATHSFPFSSITAVGRPGIATDRPMESPRVGFTWTSRSDESSITHNPSGPSVAPEREADRYPVWRWEEPVDDVAGMTTLDFPAGTTATTTTTTAITAITTTREPPAMMVRRLGRPDGNFKPRPPQPPTPRAPPPPPRDPPPPPVPPPPRGETRGGGPPFPAPV